jgi:hypothetical protein
MRIRPLALFLALILSSGLAIAKGKDKVFPPAILAAHTVAVVIDPDAGMSIDDPQANQVARKDVETVLLNWGRFQTMTVGQPADLIIVVRRGQKNLAEQTLHDPRQNNRAGAINPTNDGIQVGGQQGQPIGSTSAGPGRGDTTPSLQTEVGEQNDTFLVYDGSTPSPLSSPPLWRYMSPDALRPHAVPAVDQFRKAIADAEKAAAKKP